MISVVATIRIHADKVAEFEAVVTALEQQVAMHEPGCLLYRMSRSRAEPLTYFNMEIFRDQPALEAHIAADYFRLAAKAMRACVSQESVVEFGDTLL